MQTAESGESLVITGSADSGSATQAFSAARAELLRRPGPPGPGRRRALAALTDEWLQDLYRLAGAPDSGMALVAVGGFGREQLSPGSDIDLLLLHEGNPGDIPDRIWYPIWDSRLKLDHSVRTLAEARKVAADDVKTVLGLLDCRPVAGDEMLAERLASSIRSDWRGFAPKRVDDLRSVVEERRVRNGEVAHLLEPDLKESYGGLRDLTVLRALQASWITDVPQTAIDEPALLLANARDALHSRTGRATDRLLMQEQEGVADALGMPDATALMTKISLAGRAIAHASDQTWYRVGRATRRSPRRPFRRLNRQQRRPLAEGVVEQDGEVVLAEGAKPERDPVLVIRAAAAAAQAGIRIAPFAVDRLAQDSAPMPVPWPAEARDALVSFLGAGRAALPVWEELDQAGLTSKLLPHWEHIRGAPQRNPIHIYTVDRHLVEAAVQASRYQRDVSRPDLLLIAALFHDIGKGRPDQDHTDVGVELMGEIGPQLGFSPADTDALVSLVRHHLLLPEMATRRDPDDPATVAAVAAAVGDVTMLDLLATLTKADAQAAGPTAWSSWRAALIADLVARVRSQLRGEVVELDDALREPQEGLLAAELPEVLVEDEAPGEMLTVTIAAPDRVGLLATVAGVLALNRLDVRGSRAFNRGDIALSEWTVHPAFGDPPDLVRLREDVRRALAGTLDVDERLARRESYYATATESVLEPRVEFVADASEIATVVEVRTYDRPATLFQLARAIADCGVDVVSARADSMGASVVDVFYLRGTTGAPLDQRECAEVRKRLQDVVGVSPA